MDTVTLVENRIEEGQRLLDLLEKEGVAVRAACWVKPFERDRWSLYIATPSVDEKGMLGAYLQLVTVLGLMGDGWLTTSDIALVGERHPIVQDALDILRRFPHRKPIPSPRTLVGGISVEEIYVYSPGKVEVTVYGMIFRGEPGGTLHLSFEPHNPHSRLTVENEGERREFPAETGIDWVVAAPEGASLEWDENRRLVLAWDLHGRRMQSGAHEAWTFAGLGLHGFRFLREPESEAGQAAETE
jgi:hypothetical protein